MANLRHILATARHILAIAAACAAVGCNDDDLSWLQELDARSDAAADGLAETADGPDAAEVAGRLGKPRFEA